MIKPVSYCGKNLWNKQLRIWNPSHYLLGCVGISSRIGVLIKPCSKGQSPYNLSIYYVVWLFKPTLH